MRKCEEGYITAILDNGYEVEPIEQPGCSSCRHKRSCHIGADGLNRTLICSSSLQLQKGDRVEFELYTSVLTSALFVYLLPVFFLLLGAIIGSNWINLFADSDLNTIIGLGAALPCITLLWKVVGHKKSHGSFSAYITKKQTLT